MLQQDCTQPLGEIAERVGLSSTACWGRIQKLEENGLIGARAAMLDPLKVGVPVTVSPSCAPISTTQKWPKHFHSQVAEIDEVVDFYRMAGITDYLLRLVVPDIEGYDAVYRRLIEIPGIADISSSFSMERIKSTTALPLHQVGK